MKPLLALFTVALVGCSPAAATDSPDAETHATAQPAPAVTAATPTAASQERTNTMQLGAFSISLAVKDLPTSRAFYEKLGFTSVMGEPEQNWLILRNGTTTIGLFQGMFPSNIMTFNPGWSPTCETLPEFQDVRDIQATLKEQGVAFVQEADPDSTGVASFVITDPDGNTILVDQHVPRPGSD